MKTNVKSREVSKHKISDVLNEKNSGMLFSSMMNLLLRVLLDRGGLRIGLANTQVSGNSREHHVNDGA